MELEYKTKRFVPQLGKLVSFHSVRAFPVYVDLAAGGFIERPDDVEKRRLAAPGLADYCTHRAIIEAQIDIEKDLSFDVALPVEFVYFLQGDDFSQRESPPQVSV